jgi:UDPglucose 6-dehydrogenase
MKEPLGVIGAGWVGLVTAACFADLGHDVVVRDVVPERIADLEAGRVPIYEPGLSELLAANRERIHYTLELSDVFADARIAFVCVDTPPTRSGDADLSRVWRVVAELPEGQEQIILVMKSTVPVGTGARVRERLNRSGRGHVRYVSNPEFLAEGSGLRDFNNPDRVVVGSFADKEGDAVASLFEFVDAPVLRCDVASAEMIKMASNAFLATRISFINEIANVCEVTGADVESVAQGVGLDHRLGPHFLRAGIGYGGSCFPKDTSALKQLAANSGYHFQLLAAVIEVNELQKRRVIWKLETHLKPLRGKTVALLGLAFKPKTNDMREAPSLVLASRLIAEGAEVRGWDPIAYEAAKGVLEDVDLKETYLDAVRGADAAVIVTEWDELKGLLDPEVAAVMRTPLLVDGRNLLDPDEARAAGFTYESIGRASQEVEGSDVAEAVEPELQA